MHIVFGLFVLIVGVLIIAYSGPLTNMIGRRERADRHLGGTTQGFVIVGVIVIIMSMVIMIGGGEAVMPDVTDSTLTNTIQEK